jgi:hypothetical protein
LLHQNVSQLQIAARPFNSSRSLAQGPCRVDFICLAQALH